MGAVNSLGQRHLNRWDCAAESESGAVVQRAFGIHHARPAPRIERVSRHVPRRRTGVIVPSGLVVFLAP